jgi:hypothetical protein
MSQENNPTADQQKAEEPQPKKKYTKPEFRYERVFETMALQCGKIAGTGGSCHPRPRRS